MPSVVLKVSRTGPGFPCRQIVHGKMSFEDFVSPRIAESRSTKRIFGAWGISLGIVVLFLVWLNVDASHTEVLGVLQLSLL